MCSVEAPCSPNVVLNNIFGDFQVVHVRKGNSKALGDLCKSVLKPLVLRLSVSASHIWYWPKYKSFYACVIT